MVNVLVIDDDSHFRGIIERIILRNYDCSVRTVATESEAWRELSNNPFDLVLLDLYMDGRKSWDTLKRMGELPHRPIVIVVSCEDTRDNQEYAKVLGASDFIPKPIDFGRLKTTIDAALHRKSRTSHGRTGNTSGNSGSAGKMLVLVVSRQKTALEALSRTLDPSSFRLLKAEDGRQAAETMGGENVDAVLVGAERDRGFALEVLRQIREKKGAALRVPVIALTGESPEAVVELLRAGADDFIALPCNARVLAGKVEACARLRREYDRRLDRITLLCARDLPTGIRNEAYFKSRLKEEFDRSLRYKRNLALVLLALKNVDRVKEALGIPAGDRIFLEACEAARGILRSSDIVIRYGEDEFALIMLEATADTLAKKADMIRTRVEESVARLDGQETGVACSVGMASLWQASPEDSGAEPVRSPEELLSMANTALARARMSETERVAIFENGRDSF